MNKTILVRSTVTIVAVVALSLVSLLPTVASAQSEDKGKRAEVTARIAERKAAALLKVEEKRENAQVKTKEARATACEKQKDKITAQYERLTTQANRSVAVIDKIYTRVQGFYESGQLTVSNYDELNTAVATAQTDVKAEIAALSELDAEVDCESEDVAVAVGAFRTSATETREGLKEYRTALVGLISSLRAAAAEDKESTSDTTDDTSTEETTTDTSEETTTEETVTEEVN